MYNAQLTLSVLMMLFLAAKNECFAQTFPAVKQAREEVVGPIVFNSDWIESAWKFRHGPDHRVPMVSVPADAPAPKFEDPDSILRFILSVSPQSCVVYPSERYYYYKFNLGPRLVSGNIRFADVEDGIVHIGYFDQHNQSLMNSKSYSDGDNIEIHHNPADATVTVKFEGTTRSFHLSNDWNDKKNSLPLLDDEQAVSGILDESGYYFWLIYNDEVNQFYYVLNRSKPLPDRLVTLQEDARFHVGASSRFVFFEDYRTDRFILVGVSSEQISDNSYFDGPFDQVPPRLPLRPLLTRAYPYVESRGGIDEHGNFLKLHAQRVAISPYRDYRTLESLIPWLQSQVDYRHAASEANRWSKLVYESKSSFHRHLEARREQAAEAEAIWRRTVGRRSATPHSVAESASWPANHWGALSNRWPNDHSQELSLNGPADHDPNAGTSSTARPSTRANQ